MPIAASTASGKTQKMSICFTELLLGWSNRDPTLLRIEFRYVLQRKGNIEVPIALFADNEDFVGCCLESVLDGAHDLTGLVHSRQADQIGHVVLPFLRRVELVAVEHELFTFQGPCCFSAQDTFHFDQEPLGS